MMHLFTPDIQQKFYVFTPKTETFTCWVQEAAVEKVDAKNYFRDQFAQYLFSV